MKIKKKPKRLAALLKRKVHVNGQTWTYSWVRGRRPYGKMINAKVCILNPSRTKKWIVPYDGEVHQYEDASGDVHEDIQLTPRWVKTFVEQHLAGEA